MLKAKEICEAPDTPAITGFVLADRFVSTGIFSPLDLFSQVFMGNWYWLGTKGFEGKQWTTNEMIYTKVIPLGKQSVWAVLEERCQQDSSSYSPLPTSTVL